MLLCSQSDIIPVISPFPFFKIMGWILLVVVLGQMPDIADGTLPPIMHMYGYCYKLGKCY